MVPLGTLSEMLLHEPAFYRQDATWRVHKQPVWGDFATQALYAFLKKSGGSHSITSLHEHLKNLDPRRTKNLSAEELTQFLIRAPTFQTAPDGSWTLSEKPRGTAPRTARATASPTRSNPRRREQGIALSSLASPPQAVRPAKTPTQGAQPGVPEHQRYTGLDPELVRRSRALPLAESPARRTTRAALVLAACLCGLRAGWENGLGIGGDTATPMGSPLALLLTAIIVVLFLAGHVALIRAASAHVMPPSEPPRTVIPLDFHTREPARTVHDIAYNCVICGRALTNPQSQRQRVGSTCVKTHGPRYKMVANPVHGQWTRHKALALKAQVEAQEVADEAHLDMLQLHEEDLKNWIDYRESEAGVAAHSTYARRSTFIYLPVAVATAACLSYLVGSFYHVA